MKGVILAGGKGTSLRPLTLIMNKHLLPVFDRPMIANALETLKGLGISEICLVTGSNHVGDFTRFLGSGANFGVKLSYKIQDDALGVAHALLQAENLFFNSEKVAVVLGDNIFEKIEVPEYVFEDDFAYIFTTEVDDPRRFGVPVLDNNGNVLCIEEKPKEPKSNFAVTGFYIYPSGVFDIIRTLTPSGRGELEITDVNNAFIKQGKLKAISLKGWWTDAGTIPSLFKASMLRERMVNRKNP